MKSEYIKKCTLTCTRVQCMTERQPKGESQIAIESNNPRTWREANEREREREAEREHREREREREAERGQREGERRRDEHR